MLERHNPLTSLLAGGHRANALLLVAMIATIGGTVAFTSTFAHRLEGSPYQTHAASQTDTAQTAIRPHTTIRPISCKALPDIPGKSITVAVVDYPPNAYTPAHRHPGSIFAFVLKGTLRSQLQGSPAGTHVAGQSWFEPPGALHLFAENTSKTEPAELLATFITDKNCGPLVLPE